MCFTFENMSMGKKSCRNPKPKGLAATGVPQTWLSDKLRSKRCYRLKSLKLLRIKVKEFQNIKLCD